MITKYLLHEHANIQIIISIGTIQPLSAIVVGLQIKLCRTNLRRYCSGYFDGL